MYPKLNDDQKLWILPLSGKELYTKVNELRKQNKIDNETMKQAFSFWLNQHGLRHDQPIVFNLSDHKFTENTGKPKLYWEKYDEDITEQILKNEFQIIWNKNKNQLTTIKEVFDSL